MKLCSGQKLYIISQTDPPYYLSVTLFKKIRKGDRNYWECLLDDRKSIKVLPEQLIHKKRLNNNIPIKKIEK